MIKIHGIVIDSIKFCKGIIETEMNSATDNPMVKLFSSHQIDYLMKFKIL